MRAGLLFVTLVTLASTASTAGAQWAPGIKAGAGQSGFTGETEFDWQPGALSLSLFYSRPLAGRLSLQPELLYSQKVGRSIVGSTSLSFKADYLMVPLLLRFDLTRSAVQPYLLAGPSLIVQARCNVQFVTSGLLSEGACEGGTAGGSLNRFDLGVDAGIGVRLPLGRASLVIEGRSSASLRTEIVPLETNSSRSYGWSVLAGVTAPLRLARRPAGTSPLPGRVTRIVEAPVPAAPSADSLPRISAEALVEERAADAPRAAPDGKLISVSAIDADVRPLLVGIAREGGLDLIVANDVNRRVTVHLKDVTATQAIAAISSAAGLTLAMPQQRQLPSIVYFQLPVNVNSASAETIAARFGVSAEMARFIVESREPPLRTP